MTDRITVRPVRHDLRVPTGQQPGEYFPFDRPTEVERTRYIERRIADGDLVEEVVAAMPGAAMPDAAPPDPPVPAPDAPPRKRGQQE